MICFWTGAIARGPRADARLRGQRFAAAGERQDQLSDPRPALHGEWLVAEICENDMNFPAIVGVERARGIEHRDASVLATCWVPAQTGARVGSWSCLRATQSVSFKCCSKATDFNSSQV